MEKPLPNFADWTPRQVVVATLVVVGILITFYLLFYFRLVLFALFTAILLSTAVRPVSEWLQSRGLSRPLSVTLIILVALVGLVAFVIGLVPIFGESGVRLTQSVRMFYSDFRVAMIESPSALVRQFAYTLPWTLSTQISPAASQATGQQAFTQTLSIVGQVIQTVFLILAILLLTFFWALEREKNIRTVLLLVPSGRRQAVQDFYMEIEHATGAYLRGVFLLCIVIGVVALVAYLIIGLPNALFLGLTAGILEAVPMIGPFLGAVPAVVVAISYDPSKVIWVVLSVIIIQALENYLLVPRIMKQVTGVNAFVTLLALAAFGSLFGLAGALMAIPVAVVVQIILQRFLLDPNQAARNVPEGRDYTSKLRYEATELMTDIRKQVRHKESEVGRRSDELEEAIELLAQDLYAILETLPPISEEEVNG